MKSPRKMGQFLALAMLVSGLTGAAQAQNFTLTMYSEVNPGKYTVDPTGDLETVLSSYSSKAKTTSDSRYWTFCLESSQYFGSGKTYNATPSLAADSVPDPISAGTAFLYKEFALGNLDALVSGNGFDYSNVAGGGLKLQKTIWWLEGESGGALDVDLENLLNLTFVNSTGYLANYAGNEVGVLNLTKFNGAGGDSIAGTLRQDNLVFWGSTSPAPPAPSVPDGGTSALLLGLSLGGLGVARRFMRRA